MKFSVLTYNLRFNQAIKHAKDLMEELKPDVICFQEMTIEDCYLEYLESDTYKLADATIGFNQHGLNFGNAIYYNAKRLHLKSTHTADLPQNSYELFWVLLKGLNKPRTLIEATFTIGKDPVPIDIYNIHLTHLSSIEHRLNQLKIAVDRITKQKHEASRIVLTGDFNFSFGRKELEEFIQEYNLKEATTNLAYTFFTGIFNILKMKLDYILYRNMKVKHTKRITPTKSDHFPVLSEFEL